MKRKTYEFKRAVSIFILNKLDELATVFGIIFLCAIVPYVLGYYFVLAAEANLMSDLCVDNCNSISFMWALGLSIMAVFVFAGFTCHAIFKWLSKWLSNNWQKAKKEARINLKVYSN